MGEAVKVVVRCRPLNERENRLNSNVVVKMDSAIVQVQLIKPKAVGADATPKLFTFDGVYYIKDTTKQIYEDICFPLVSGVLEGYNGTVFAYGQTGCGKSYTMMGVQEPAENQGVIPRAFNHIFDHITVNSSVKYLVRASYLEIYNEEVRDLLGKDVKKKLDLHERADKGVYVQGLSFHRVQNVDDLERVMTLGSNNRSVGATLMNVDSSRSHSIFSIDMEMIEGDGSNLRAGRLNLVDLAGSERQSKTGSTGERLKEATKINLSLSALGNVISALVDGKSKHVPYRDSKLTRLLQSSLGGNTKTLMVACISPADNNYDETLSTLRYANRAKNIKNKPKINEDPKDALLREYKEEIEKLKQLLMGKNIDITAITSKESQPDVRSPIQRGPSESQLKQWEEEKEAIKREYEAQISEIKTLYGQEQTNKEQLQQKLNKLQENRDQQLSQAQEKLNATTATTVTSPPPEEDTALTPEQQQQQEEKEEEQQQQQQLQQQQQQQQQDEDAIPQQQGDTVVQDMESFSPKEGTEFDSLNSEHSHSKDRAILEEHEMAMKRLEELQNELIGGERAADDVLKKELEARRQFATQRQEQLLTTNALLFEDEDENVLEKIFTNITEEVRVKTKVIERTKAKLDSAQEDIKDLYSEFELERQELLHSIREQDRTLKLYEQLLDTVVPCLRRDCNYFNMDKIKVECRWNEDAERWDLPKLTVSKTVLSPASLPKGSLPGGVGAGLGAEPPAARRVKDSSPMHGKSNKWRHNSNYSSSDINIIGREGSSQRGVGGGSLNFAPSSNESFSDDERHSGGSMPHSFGHRSDDSLDYFKPKRQLELMSGGSGSTTQGLPAAKEGFSPKHHHHRMTTTGGGGGGGGGGGVGTEGSDSNSSLPKASTAAAVHRVDPLTDTGYGRRPPQGKLQSLAQNAPPPPAQPTREDLLEKMEKKMATSKKNLQPLADLRNKKASL